MRIRPYRTVDNVIDGVVLTFVDITERQQHKLERGRLAAIVDSSRDIIVGHGLDGTITSWNASAERILGYTADYVLGKSIALLAPGKSDGQTHELMQACAQHRQATDMEMQWSRQDGSQVQVLVTCSPVTDAEGKVIAGSLIARDNTERMHADQALHTSERRLTQLIEQTTAGVAQLDPDGRFVLVNPAFCTIVGRRAEALYTMRMHDISHPEDLDASARAVRTLLDGGPATQLEKRYLRPDGSSIWASSNLSAVVGHDGQPEYVLAVVQDSSERRRAAEHTQLLLGELNHRVKNTLASVQAIALQTAAGSSDLESFRDTFLARLTALSNTHNLLAKGAWDGADLRQIVDAELAPYEREGEGRIELGGKALQLDPKTALALSMALHELATNAGKYGALSVAHGRVAVQWKTRNVHGQAWLHLRWTERDGPPVATPTHRGFGSRLISDGLAFELDGEVALEFEPAGVTCRIDVPLTEATER